jgi:hypothetical protein
MILTDKLKKKMRLYWYVLSQGEITVTNKDAVLNKYYLHKKAYNLPLILINELIHNEVICLDSGNFETGEDHYIVNRDKESFIKGLGKVFDYICIMDSGYNDDFLIQIKRDIKLEKILNYEI